MSRTIKPGKRDKHTRAVRTPPREAGGAERDRRLRGSTERILRRNRKTWTRTGNKRRRRAGRETVEVSDGKIGKCGASLRKRLELLNRCAD